MALHPGEAEERGSDYLFGLSRVEWVEGCFARAEELAGEAVALASQKGQPVTSAGYEFGVAVYAHDDGHHDAVTPALTRSLPILLKTREEPSLNHWLWTAARVQPEESATVHILGAQATLAKRTGFAFCVPIRRDVYRSIERASIELKDEFFDRAWAEGQAASFEQASAFALDGLADLN